MQMFIIFQTLWNGNLIEPLYLAEKGVNCSQHLNNLKFNFLAYWKKSLKKDLKLQHEGSMNTIHALRVPLKLSPWRDICDFKLTNKELFYKIFEGEFSDFDLYFSFNCSLWLTMPERFHQYCQADLITVSINGWNEVHAFYNSLFVYTVGLEMMASTYPFDA